jgi:DnaJ-class molecular chaperone
MDDVEIDDIPCPACGCPETRSQRCPECWGEGEHDAYEDDPINEDPGTYTPCFDCSGTGILRWCPKCGADYWRAKRKAKAAG